MGQTAFILILGSDAERGRRLRDVLRERYSHSCNVVARLDDALDSIRQRPPDVVVADTPAADSATTSALVQLLDSLARDAVLLTAGGADSSAAPPQHIVLQPLPATDDPRELAEAVNQAAAKAVARREDRLLQQSMASQKLEVFEGIVGISPSIHRIIERIRKAARNKLTVLILGETGTGKELIAEAIHKHSDRARRPLKAVNCAGLNENLLESELFGHVKGSFTGAVSDRKGYFQAAEGGTLFLDEVGDMPLTMQAKLLRALERREITSVGSTETRKVDVRVVAATHADLRKLVEEKKFREDLFYRLNQWVIDVPPLRERRQDIPVLVQYLLQRANDSHGVRVPSATSEAMGHLARYFWPGNVRELANVIESVACEVIDRPITAEDLPENIRSSRELVPISSGGLVGLTMDQVERLMIERTLRATSGNREQAAKILNIGTRTLYRKIKEYGL